MIAFFVLAGILGLIILVILLFGFALIRDFQVGILTKKMSGITMPEGHIIARKGEIGVQAGILMPGLYWRLPFVWTIEKVRVTEIAAGEVGVVESVDGMPLDPGRLLGDAVECDSFQNAKAFLDNGGRKGPQVAFLKPGTYRINTKVFQVTKSPRTVIEAGNVGVVQARDGIALPSNLVIAPSPKQEHNHFQNGQNFISSEGYRGTQLETLQPGSYYINSLLFQITPYDVADVPPGYVAVIRSNVGEELSKPKDLPSSPETGAVLSQPLHEEVETLLITDKSKRGIWKEPVAPGKYNLNPVAYTPYLVPTSAVTIDWASGTDVRSDVLGAKPQAKIVDTRTETTIATEFFKFSQLKLTSKDSFILNADVRMVIRIQPANAAYIIARFGSVVNLIEQIVHPLIDSSFRNKAGEEKAIEFVQGRTRLQAEALDRAKLEFAKYNVEAQNLLISYIDVPENLRNTQTEKEIALQQQEQYKQQAMAQEQRIAVKEKEARADKQKDVIDAKLSIDINADKATAMMKEADGIKYKERTVGEGIAEAYKAQVDAIGKDNVAIVKLIQEVATGNVKITPDIVVSGDGQGALFNAFLATMIGKKDKPNPDKPELK